jgi:hypothetical protein
MWTWMMEFYNNVWHPYWTIFDLFITVFILYELRKVSKNLDKVGKQTKDEE